MCGYKGGRHPSARASSALQRPSGASILACWKAAVVCGSSRRFVPPATAARPPAHARCTATRLEQPPGQSKKEFQTSLESSSEPRSNIYTTGVVRQNRNKYAPSVTVSHSHSHSYTVTQSHSHTVTPSQSSDAPDDLRKRPRTESQSQSQSHSHLKLGDGANTRRASKGYP